MTRARRIRTLLLGTVACAAALVLGGLAAAPASAAIPAVSPVTAAAHAVQPDLLPVPLQQGSTGSAVVLWQRDLNTFINYPPPSCRPTLTVDGIFGPATTNATKCFQSSTVGLTRDGIVGPQTRGAMCSFLWAIGSTTLFNETCL
jgi:hypothetical protein